MPVEQVETAYEYLIRELGNEGGTLTPEGINQSEHGLTIKLRPIPIDKIKELRFGYTKSKQKPLRIDKNGNPSILSVSSCIRKMSDETKIILTLYLKRKDSDNYI